MLEEVIHLFHFYQVLRHADRSRYLRDASASQISDWIAEDCQGAWLQQKQLDEEVVPIRTTWTDELDECAPHARLPMPER